MPQESSQPKTAVNSQVLEVRIHGVSNTPPQFVLGLTDAEQIERVVGDDSTAFYRAKGPIDPLLDTQAYSWGQLTSGIRAKKDLSRGFWMLLLPFALANVGFWARRDPKGHHTWDISKFNGPASYAMRLFALSLTVTLTLATTALSVDLVAWQWLHSDPAYVRDVAQLHFLQNGWWSEGTRPLALALALPVVVLFLIFLVARGTFQYEAEVAQRRPDPQATTSPADPTQEPQELDSPLESKWFWRGRDQVPRLAYTHLRAAVACAFLATVVPAVVDDLSGNGTVRSWVTSALAILPLVLVLLLVLSQLSKDEVTSRSAAAASARWNRSARASLVLLVLGCAATVIYLLWVASPGFAPDCGASRSTACRDYPGFAETVLLLFVGQFLLLLAIAAGQRWSAAWVWVLGVVEVAIAVFVAANAVTWSRWPDWLHWTGAQAPTPAETVRMLLVLGGVLAVLCLLVVFVPGPPAVTEPGTAPGDPVWRGLGGPMLMMLGWLAALLYSAGLLFYAADWLSDGKLLYGGGPAVELPSPLQWAATGLVLFAVALLVVAAVAGLLLRRHLNADAKVVAAEYVGPGFRKPSSHERQRAHTVAAARRFHVFMQDRSLNLVGWLCFAMALLVVLGIAAAVNWQDFEGAPAWLVVVRDVGVRLSLLLLLGIVGLGVLVYRGDPHRRVISIVWDLTTFWPRAGHPLAPPCYAERCVPQLVTRVGNDTYGRHGYILSGHSQGAVLALATVLQLPAHLRDRVFLLTYGTQLRALYGRGFPRFFGPEHLRHAARLLASEPWPGWLRWRSLVRLTDPMGYPVDVPVMLPTTPERHAQVDRPGHLPIRPLRDPAGLAPIPGDIEDPPIRGHSDYNLDPVFDAVTRDAAARLAAP
jgi:hypothetical protein